MKRALLLCYVLGCAVPDEPIVQGETSRPQEIAPGLFRLTDNGGGDHPRAFLPDGRVLYQSEELAGAAAGVTLLSLHPDSGEALEQAGAYRAALGTEQLTQLVPGTVRRTLLALTAPIPRSHWCGDPAHPTPGPPWAGWHLYALPPLDGPALSSLLSPEREFPVFVGTGRDSVGAFYTTKRIRIVPAIAEADSLGTNPWGPAVAADEQYAYVSDAERVWRYDLADSTVAPVVVTFGAYPLLSPDGSTLYVARPNITDSALTVTSVQWSLFWSCTQTMVTYTTDGWTLVRRALASGAEDTVGLGVEPATFDDTALVVRRADGIYRVTLTGGEARLVTDSTATSPIISPDGRLLVFASRRFGNPDVLVLRLN